MTHTLPITFLNLLTFPRYIVVGMVEARLARKCVGNCGYLQHIGLCVSEVFQPHDSVGLLASARLGTLDFLSILYRL